jgi:hypothetical protein
LGVLLADVLLIHPAYAAMARLACTDLFSQDLLKAGLSETAPRVLPVHSGLE